MTAKEKAKELVDKFIPHTKVFHEVLGWEDYIDSAKQCALIAVDEILESHYKLLSGVNTTIYKYWIEVKQEIENL
jgi:hypothetical protein